MLGVHTKMLKRYATNQLITLFLSYARISVILFSRSHQFSHAELKTLDWETGIIEALDVASGWAVSEDCQ